MKVEKRAFAGRGLNVGQTGEGRDQRESVCHHPRPGTWSRILVQKGHHRLDREGRVKKLRGFRLGPVRAGDPALPSHEPPKETAGASASPPQRPEAGSALPCNGLPQRQAWPARGLLPPPASPSAHHLPRWEQRREIGTDGTWPHAQTPGSPLGLPF